MPAEDTTQKQRLYWRCRRGMLELDLLLRNFLDERYDALNKAEQAAFRALLVYPDAELIEWLMGRSTPMDGEIAHVVQRIRAHAAR